MSLSWHVQVTAVELAREEIVSRLKRRKHQEVMEKTLMATSLRSSKLGWRFHLNDLKGKGVVELIARGHNTVVRLRRP
jgi:predicted ArsR family transcriptional regulator